MVPQGIQLGIFMVTHKHCQVVDFKSTQMRGLTPECYLGGFLKKKKKEGHLSYHLSFLSFLMFLLKCPPKINKEMSSYYYFIQHHP